jgi:hypothetical protein
VLLVLAVAVGITANTATARAGGPPVLGPQDVARASKLVAGARPPVDLGDGYTLESVDLAPLHITAVVAGPAPGRLTLAGRCGATTNLPPTRSFELAWRGVEPVPPAVLGWVQSIGGRDDGSFWRGIDPCSDQAVAPPVSQGPPAPSPWPALGYLLAVCLAWLVATWTLDHVLAWAPGWRGAAGAAAARIATTVAAVAAVTLGPSTGDLGRMLPPFALGLAMTLGPSMAGLWLGSALRRLLGPLGPGLAAAICAAPPLYGWWLLGGPLGVSPSDVLYGAALASLGFWLGARSSDARALRIHLLLFGTSLIVALCLGELAVRLLLPATQPMPPADEARLTIDIVQEAPLCNALYPVEFPLSARGVTFEARTGVDRERPLHVLHVGDSVTQGVGVEPPHWFTTLLAQAQPEVAHINAGYSGSGTDFHYLLIASWLDRMRFDLVVLHMFDNDLNDMSAHYLCCPDGPLLDYSGPVPAARCPTARATPQRLAVLRHSPAPYAIRVATAVSRLAAHLTLRLGGTPTSADNFALADQARVLERIATVTRAHGTRFAVVRLPAEYEADLSGPAPTATPPAQAAALRALGVPLLDPAPDLFAAAPSGDVSRWYIGDRTHYNEAGHRYIADWLAPRLRAILDAPPLAPAGPASPAP